MPERSTLSGAWAISLAMVQTRTNVSRAFAMQPNLVCLLGNHDAAALSRIPIETFNQDARRSIEWMQNVLTKESYTFLSKLPETVVIDQVTLVHGSPRNPVWEYILDLHNATQNMEHFDTQFCMVGHTHLPIAYCLDQTAAASCAGRCPPKENALSCIPAPSSTLVRSASRATTTRALPMPFSTPKRTAGKSTASNTISARCKSASAPPTCPCATPCG